MTQNIAPKIVSTASNIPLNWKNLRRVFLLSILVAAIFSSLYYQQLKHQFDTHRASSQTHDEQLLNLSIKQSALQHKQLIKIFSSLTEVYQAIESANPDKLIESFDKHWLELKETSNLGFAGFYSLSGKPLAIWSENKFDKALQQQLSKWTNIVKQSSQSLSVIDCNLSCNRYFISPLVFNEQKLAYLIFANPLDKIFSQNKLDTNRVTGILSPAENPETSSDSDILVNKWGHSIIGIIETSNSPIVLRHFAKTFPDISGETQILNSTINQQHYELAIYPLNLSDKSLFIILDDITQGIRGLYLNTLQFGFIIFSVLVVLQLLLVVTLNRLFFKAAPILESVIDNPINASNIEDNQIKPDTSENHDSAKPQVNNLSRDKALLTEKLDLLEHYNKDIKLELANQTICLNSERSIVNLILDNSPTIIMTLFSDGTIASMNQYGEKITGFSSDELLGKNFIDLYPANAPLALNDLQTISSIANKDQPVYQHQAHLSRKGGSECIILWLHSRLDIEEENFPHILSIGMDITQQKKLEKNLSWLVNHDTLTSLFNRSRFENELNEAVSWAKKQQADGTLLTIDLDNFKDINDSCGHKVGDIILRKVATTIRALTKQVDISVHKVTARIGGDEFAIILRNIDEEGACTLSKKIITALNKITHLQRHVSFQLSSSIGIATFSTADHNATELLSNANYARNQAKIDGRNQFHVFKAEYSHLEQTHHRMIWRERIENALKNDRFVLYFQPILNIQQSTISHYETLIRMLGENNEIIAPDLFINIAEQFGLIQQIDSFIISSAIAKQGKLRRQGDDVTLTINLSGKAFDDPELYRKIKTAIQINKANPEHLIFEITETFAMSNIIAAEKVMMQIQSIGCQFALDDFGIGFSSFQYLRQLPVEYVKIDGSFVNDLANNSDNKVLVHALSEVAIGFNKLTVAEFVDSRETLDILREAKVNYAQGYFIGKPCETIPVDLPDNLFTTNFNKPSLH